MIDSPRGLLVLAPGFVREDVTETVAFLQSQGLVPALIGPEPEVPDTAGESSGPIAPLTDANPPDASLLFLPGGAPAAEVLRQDERVLDLVRRFLERGHGVLVAIGHAAQVLVSARVLAGRTVTCWPALRDDVEFAGARYVDRRVCVDGRLLTARSSRDLPALHVALLGALGLAEPRPGERPPDPSPSEAEAQVADEDPVLDGTPAEGVAEA